MFRSLTSGEVINRGWMGLDYLRSAGVQPDERIAEAVDVVAAHRKRWADHGAE